MRVAEPQKDAGHPLEVEEARGEHERLARTLHGQYRLTRVLAEPASAEEARRRLREEVCEALDWDAAFLWEPSREGDNLLCVEAYCPVDVGDFEEVSRTSRFPPGVGLAGRVWESGCPAWIADVRDDPNFPRAPFATSAGLRTGFAFPVVLGGEVKAVIEAFSREARERDDQQVVFLGGFGTQFGQYLERHRVEKERARLLEEERAARAHAQAAEKRMAFLARASLVLDSPLQLEERLEQLSRVCVPEVADWCAVHLGHQGGIRPAAIAHAEPSKVAFAWDLLERFPGDPDAPLGPEAVIRTGRSELVPEVTDELLKSVARNEEHLELLRRVGITSYLCVPLRARGATLGSITLAIAESGRALDQEQLRVAEELCARAALALDNARLYDELRFGKSLLESQSEATIDGILVVSEEGRIVFCNRLFAEMWEIPEEVLERRSDEEALQRVLDKLADPSGFMERVRYLYEHPDERSRDEIALEDGRTFDRWSAPLRAGDGSCYGRAWYFRDVSEQKREQQERAHLYEAERQARLEAETARSRLGFLLEASTMLAASLDYDEDLHRLARLAVPVLADLCVISVVEPGGRMRQVAAVHADPGSQELVAEILPCGLLP